MPSSCSFSSGDSFSSGIDSIKFIVCSKVIVIETSVFCVWWILKICDVTPSIKLRLFSRFALWLIKWAFMEIYQMIIKPI